jgi:putative ABC transport system permease protein
MPNDEPRWRRYLRFWRSNAAADVDDELRFHLEESIDELVATGMDHATARREALRRFGPLDQISDTCRTLALEQERSMSRSDWFGALMQDLTYALRSMHAHPSLTAAIVLTIALGIGGTTSIFSVVNAVLLRPLPYTDADRIVALRERVGSGDQTGSVGIGPFADWSEQSRALEATALSLGRTYNLTDDEPARFSGATVTNRYFEVLNAPPALGRYFLPDETDASRVVVLGHSLWQSRFNGDSSIVGREIPLNGEQHTVIGVAPPEFTLTPSDEQLWTILTFTPEQRAKYGSHVARAYAKLKAGVTIAQAQRELDQIAAGIRARHPDTMGNRGAAVLPFRDWRLGDYETQLWVLLGAVTVVLLIGCINVASLLLARATSRRKEIAIRAALGGARSRLVRQLLTESLVIAALGGAVGLLIARLGVRFLVGGGPSELPRLREAGLQLDVLAFAAVATMLCGLLFGVAPALRATRINLQKVLRDGGRGSGAATRDRMRATLIVSEIAVTLVLRLPSRSCCWSRRRCCSGAQIGCVRSTLDSSRVV